MENRRESNLRIGSRWVLTIAFVVAGANHFRTPETYLSMMPPWLPAPELLNLVSGAAEIAGALGILHNATRRIAAIGLILLLVAVFPANLQVAIHGWPGTEIPQWVLVARLPFQIIFIWWIIYACQPKLSRRPRPALKR